MRRWVQCAVLLVMSSGIGACTINVSTPQAFNATAIIQPSFTPTEIIPTATETLENTATASATPTLTPTPTPIFTDTPSPTPTPEGTQALFTLTPASALNNPPEHSSPPLTPVPTDGWSCGDFPCADDIDGWLERIQVPSGYQVEFLGRFPGQVQQITYGGDGRLYATVLENGTRIGAVYRLMETGAVERYAGDFYSPLGIVAQPGTNAFYVTARIAPMSGGALWRIPETGGIVEPVFSDLPCCYQLIDNQPNGLIFGNDGYLYMGVGSLTDRTEPLAGRAQGYQEVQPYEASILRVQPHTGEITEFATGIRNPFDITFTSSGEMYVTDSGLISGIGDRLLRVRAGEYFGWPYYRDRGCEDCQLTPNLTIQPDLLTLAERSLPRGLVAYQGQMFPANTFDTLYIALWNNIEGGQQIVHVVPSIVGNGYVPEPFMTGIIRPIDVTVAPDGALIVADYVYGHIWRVVYVGN